MPELEPGNLVGWIAAQCHPGPAVIWCLLLFGTAFFLGRLALGRRPCRPPAAAAGVQLATGLNLLALAALFMTLFGLAGPAFSRFILLFGAAGAGWYFWHGRAVAAKLWRRCRRQPGFWLAAAGALLLAGPALAPPSSWDELVYHLPLPQRWLADNSACFYPDLPYSAFPNAAGHLYTLAISAGNLVAPRLLVFGCWLLLLAMVYALLRPRCGRFQAATLAAALGLGRTVLLTAHNSYSEIFILMNLAALLLLLRESGPARAGAGWRRILALGILGGGALAFKLTAVLLPLLPAAWLLLRRRPPAWRPAVALLLVAAMFAAPFYARAYLDTGNPVYPYFAGAFSGNPAVLAMSEHHHRMGSLRFGVRTWQMFFSGPLVLGLDRTVFDGSLGWQFLLVLALALLAMRRAEPGAGRRRGLFTVGAALAFYAFWFCTAPQARFVVPAALLLLPAAAAGLARFRKSLAAKCGLAAALWAVTILSMPWELTGYWAASWLAAAGRLNRVDYLHGATGERYLPAMQAVAAIVPPDAKVMLIFEPRQAWLPRRGLVATPLFQERFFTPPETAAATPEAVEAVLAESGADFVLVGVWNPDPDVLPGHLERSAVLLRNLLEMARRGCLVPVWQSEDHLLYRCNF